MSIHKPSKRKDVAEYDEMCDFELSLSSNTMDKIRWLFLYLYIFYLVCSQRQLVTAERPADLRLN